MDLYEFAAWCIDFEGYVIITRSQHTETKQFMYNCKVGIEGTSRRHLELFCKRVGYGYVNPNPKIREKGNDQYTWLMPVAVIKVQLPLIKGHLFLKAKQADLVLELLEIRMPATTAPSHRSGYYSIGMLTAMDSLYLACTKLNAKTFPEYTEAEKMYRMIKGH